MARRRMRRVAAWHRPGALPRFCARPAQYFILWETASLPLSPQTKPASDPEVKRPALRDSHSSHRQGAPFMQPLSAWPTVSSQSQPAQAPQLRLEAEHYLVHFARTTEEIEAALKLRFEVFNLELGEGLDSSFRTGRDRDEFDATSHHLIVKEKSSDKVIGTYRVRTSEIAAAGAGFYSAAEFALEQLPPPVIASSIELGRACIALEHRDRRVLFLLWKALARYVMQDEKRYLFGCCSLTSQEPAEGLQLYQQLRRAGHVQPHFSVAVRKDYECRAAGGWTSAVQVPRLFSTYLDIGAQVCSLPALDRRFKTI